jgi:hypothetical protein
MPQLDVLCDLGISFNMDSSWTTWTLYIKIVFVILVQSDFIWTWDHCHLKGYLVLFPCIYNVQILFGMHHVHQFEAKVVLDDELDSKSNSRILNWIGSPP